MDQHISKSAVSSPASSPGLYSPSPPTQRQFSSNSEGTPINSPYLHPLQMHKVRETHKAAIEQDFITGRKLINQYEILDEIGRGVHGKVKLARNLETSEYVAIKIIQRFSKKRRLGKVTVSPEAKTKREIAILKKIRHPNIVGLLEVIDDPELKKIYMVLEYVELGEVVWRKKGTPLICAFERRRIERELRGEMDAGEDERYFRVLERRRQRKETQQAKLRGHALPAGDFWSLEHGDDEEDFDLPSLSRTSTHDSGGYLSRSHASHTSMIRSTPGSATHSRATSRAPSAISRTPSRASFVTNTPLPTDFDHVPPVDSENEDEDVGPLPLMPSTHSSGVALHSSLSNQQIHPGSDEASFRGRSPSMADSIVSHMSSVDDITQHDMFEEDFSYVPCFTMDQARSTFRDTVLGLEYLHYEGIVHRDIKPANLLWTRDHRVKISDFGVSYFGRPIRDGEQDESISETDAEDFDDDLELAKTVGTPAFFAPELCYTDLDVVQPKVTEQIDVWSLGVTLYCLIYARIPFLADDEYQLFRAIATQDVYIPRKRLKPVNPFPPVTGEAPPPEGIYRDDEDLVMEGVDDELYDLLRRMLLKDPTERMKLREVKRHPWVLRGIDNVIGWLDDTDPSRRTSGRRIQVDDKELEHAVIPITFLERARSAVKKTLGKAFGRSDTSRKRAVSSATSGGSGETGQRSPSVSMRDTRRASLRGDESYFAITKELKDLKEHDLLHHPLAQSVTASPEHVSPSDSFDQLAGISASMPVTPRPSGVDTNFPVRPGPPDRNIATTSSIQTVIHKGHSHSRSLASSIPSDGTDVTEIPTSDLLAAFTDHRGGIIRESSRSLNTARSMDLKEATTSGSTTRAHSTDRPFFNAPDKHSEAVTGVSMAVAPGNVAAPTPVRRNETRSMDSSPTASDHQIHQHHHPHHTISAHHFFRAGLLTSHHQSMSSPNVPVVAAEMLEDRPATANRLPEARTPAPRPAPSSTKESFAKAHEQLARRQRLEAEAEEENNKAVASARQVDAQSEKAPSECPPSPDDEVFHRKQDEAMRAKSTSSMNSISLVSPVTSPSDVTSPISSTTLESSNLGGSQDQLFPSDPSLPALLSGASSVSADLEGEFLTIPGTVQALSTGSPETLTPPSLSKLSSHEDATPTPSNTYLETVDSVTRENFGDYHPYGDLTLADPPSDDDDDSDSDEGLTMSKSKKPQSTPVSPPKRSLERRGTNASVESTDTAKKVSVT